MKSLTKPDPDKKRSFVEILKRLKAEYKRQSDLIQSEIKDCDKCQWLNKIRKSDTCQPHREEALMNTAQSKTIKWILEKELGIYDR